MHAALIHRTRELGLDSDSKSVVAGFNPLASCSRGLGLADGERGEEAKAQLGESPGDHAFAPTQGERPAHIRYGDGSIPSGATKFFEV